MELRHLRYFCAVAAHGSFSKASRALHVSQSAISEQIADLEREMGGPLLNRRTRQTELTPHGRLFLPEAHKTLLAAEHAMDVARRSLLGQTGTLAIGFFLWGAGDFFSRLIREYRELRPDIRLSLNEMHAQMQLEALATGKLDVGFTRPVEPPYDRTIRSELLYRDPVVVVLPRAHRLAGAPVQIMDLAAERFVMCERRLTPALFDSVLSMCSRAGFAPEIAHQASGWPSVLTLVESGEGIALVPSGVRYLATPGLVFSELLPETTHVGISIAWNASRENPVVTGFLDLVRKNKDRIQKNRFR